MLFNLTFKEGLRAKMGNTGELVWCVALGRAQGGLSAELPMRMLSCSKAP